MKIDDLNISWETKGNGSFSGTERILTMVIMKLVKVIFFFFFFFYKLVWHREYTVSWFSQKKKKRKKEPLRLIQIQIQIC